MNRRQFLARTASLNIPLLALPQALATPGDSFAAAGFERVVADTRIPQSNAFAAAMKKRGAPVAETAGDLTRLWFDDLARRFEVGGLPVAGLTTMRTALVMIELTRSPGVRVLWHAEHAASGESVIEHRAYGSAALVSRTAQIGAGRDWSVSLANMLADETVHTRIGPQPNVSTVERVARPTTGGAALADAPDAPDAPAARAARRASSIATNREPLASWVLMPRGPATKSSTRGRGRA